MPESASSTVMILLSSALGLLVLLLVLLIGISRRLKRVENRLSGLVSTSSPADSAPSHAETSPGGAFETFLKEDPARRALPKAEQFAEYRKWRQQNGLNWSNS